MGVLDESDIEKVAQAIKKRNIPKFFNDPVKGYRAYDIAVTVAIGASVIAGFLFVMIGIISDQLTDANKNLVDQRDNQVNLITNNADCPSLFSMYNDAKNNPNLDYTRQTIKDEIAFRCK